MADRRIFLHIGMSKAGSSAIQQALVSNADALAKSGICYPETGRRWGNAHYKLLRDLRNGGLGETLTGALQEARSKESVVLSCEGFWLIQDETLKDLHRAFEKYEVHIFFYLRRPSDYAASSYRQSIKHDGETRTPEEYWHDGRPHSHLNYSRQLKRWARYFPLRVRSYEAVKHGIEEDFLRAIGAPLRHHDTERRVANPTPNDSVMQCMLLANRYLPEVFSKQVRRWARRLNWRLNFMPGINDAVLRKQARTVVDRWEVDVLRESLPEDDLELLLSDGDADSAG
jgi:hypothetical protein